MNQSTQTGRINLRRVVFVCLTAGILATGMMFYAPVMDWLVGTHQSQLSLLSNLDVGIRALAFLAAAWSVDHLVDQLIVTGVVERRLGRRIPDIIRGVISASLYGAGIFLILVAVFGISPLVVLGITAGSLILLGAPFRGVIDDVVAGTSLSMDPNFGIGMVIETAAGQVGRVVNMGIVRVRLERADGSISVLRNSILSRDGFVVRANVDAPTRQQLIVPIPLDIPSARVSRLLVGAALATSGVSNLLEPEVLLHEITETALRYRLIFGVDDILEAERVRSRLAGTLLQHIAKAGLSLAAPPVQYVASNLVTDRSAVNLDVIFRRLELFTVLTDNERMSLLQGAIGQELPRDAVICHHGDSGDSLFIVVEGVLEVSIAGPTGERIVLARIEPGNYVGEMSLLTGAPRSADVVARSAVYVLEVRSEFMKPILELRPELAESLAMVMVQRQRALEQATTTASNAPRTGEFRALVAQIANRIKVFFSIRKTA